MRSRNHYCTTTKTRTSKYNVNKFDKKKAEADGEKNVTSLHLCRMKNGTFARLARAFSLFVHFEAVLS